MVDIYRKAIKIPEQLFEDEVYKPMSNNAKLLYGLLGNKLEQEIGIAEIWDYEITREYYGKRPPHRDETGHIYINYPTEELASLLNVSKSTVTKLFKELEGANLITRKKRGLGKPDNIYVGIPKDKDSPYYKEGEK